MPTTRKTQVIMLFNQRRKNIEVIINVLSNPLKLSFLINLQCDSLTFFAAVLNASLWLISGLLALILWISSLHYHEYFIALEINDKREEKEAVRRMLIIYIYIYIWKTLITSWNHYFINWLYAEGTRCLFSGAEHEINSTWVCV